MTKELQTQVLSLRMQPLTGLFQRLERTCRDLNGHLGKNVELVLKGAEVELDKSVIEKISEPLVHILRNAIDHGIGSLEEWAESGKAVPPRVDIEALQDPSGISICVKDNGRGIDPDDIHRTALSKGLLKEDAVLDEKRKLELILLPGFSTAKTVTDISGRGVGMDVVQKAITELGGRLQIDSRKGQGTAFTITLPTSLNIIDALIIGVEGVQYAVPIGDLVEVLEHGRMREYASAAETPYFELRGEVIPVRELRRHLKTGGARPGRKSPEGGRYALITRTPEANCAFVIDEVVGKQQVVVRQLTGTLASIEGIHGGTILANGEPGFILDLPHLAGEAKAAA
jgi:two-component system chemotaxis sensor kinase CheA